MSRPGIAHSLALAKFDQAEQKTARRWCALQKRNIGFVRLVCLFLNKKKQKWWRQGFVIIVVMNHRLEIGNLLSSLPSTNSLGRNHRHRIPVETCFGRCLTTKSYYYLPMILVYFFQASWLNTTGVDLILRLGAKSFRIRRTDPRIPDWSSESFGAEEEGSECPQPASQSGSWAAANFNDPLTIQRKKNKRAVFSLELLSSVLLIL